MRGAAIWAGVLVMAAAPAFAAPRCAAGSPAKAIEAVTAMYAAATADDLAAFQRATTPDFYAFDNGRRFDGGALMALVGAAHAKGDRYVWTVTEPDVRIDCRSAWIAYINRGSLTDAAGTRPLTWLESVALVPAPGGWRVRFLHSMRMAEAPPPAKPVTPPGA